MNRPSLERVAGIAFTAFLVIVALVIFLLGLAAVIGVLAWVVAAAWGALLG